jgi:hypothetical protein
MLWRAHPRERQRPQPEAHGVEGERQRRGGGEQQRTDRPAEELVGDELGGAHAAVGRVEAVARGDQRDDRLQSAVHDDLTQADAHRDGVQAEQRRPSNRHRHGEHPDAGPPDHLHRDDHPPTVTAVGDRSADGSEQQPRKVGSQRSRRPPPWDWW